MVTVSTVGSSNGAYWVAPVAIVGFFLVTPLIVWLARKSRTGR